MHGFLNIDKPAGMTSHDVVARIRRLSGQRRVGHAGTLDPAATGVLVVGLGQATRLIPYVQDETLKRYIGQVTFGIRTTSDDAEGEILARAAVPALERKDIEQLLESFRGDIWQIPPMYAALHHNGERLYDIARRGETVERQQRAVQIVQLIISDWQSPVLTIDVTCSKGTYIRALARDIGEALGCGGHLSALRRIAVGDFTIDGAVTLEQLANNVPEALLPPTVALRGWPIIAASDEELRRLQHGLPIHASNELGLRAQVHDHEAQLAALVEQRDGLWYPFRVFSFSNQ